MIRYSYHSDNKVCVVLNALFDRRTTSCLEVYAVDNYPRLRTRWVRDHSNEEFYIRGIGIKIVHNFEVISVQIIFCAKWSGQ